MSHADLRVRTLYTRRRRLHAALADMERREAVIRKSITDVETELLTHVLFVPPLRRNKPTATLGRDLLDYLRECDTPQTTREIALWVMREKGVEVVGARQLQGFINRVWRVLTGLRERGDLRCEVESRRVIRWNCLNTN